MNVLEAKTLAEQWIHDNISHEPGFRGAFYHGSINWMADDEQVPATSDVDLMVVYDEPPPVKLGKFRQDGVMLEVSYLPSSEVQSAEDVLRTSHLAGSFHTASIIADPTGQLTELQAAVAHGYAQRRWVRARCESVARKLRRNVESLDESRPFYQNATAWSFAAGLTTHLILVAALRNPTVRKRYVAARQVLADYGHLDFHETLLALLGCADMSRDRVEQHLAAMTAAFDAAKTVVRSPFFFASDISDVARPLAVDGSRNLIERGLHREAVFWIIATYARCQQIFDHDADESMGAQFTPGFCALMADLGVASWADLQRGGDEIQAQLPQVWRVAAAIMDANPALAGDLSQPEG